MNKKIDSTIIWVILKNYMTGKITEKEKNEWINFYIEKL